MKSFGVNFYRWIYSRCFILHFSV